MTAVPKSHRRLDREDAVPDLREGADDDAMVVRRIELEKAVEELLEVVFGVDVLLQDHLEHGMPEIEVRVVGVFLDDDALAADSPEALHRPEALDFGIGVEGGVGRGERRGGASSQRQGRHPRRRRFTCSLPDRECELFSTFFNHSLLVFRFVPSLQSMSVEQLVNP
nr:hypothetical protein DM860_010446 [Ipomoea batatas]